MTGIVSTISKGTDGHETYRVKQDEEHVCPDTIRDDECEEVRAVNSRCTQCGSVNALETQAYVRTCLHDDFKDVLGG